MSWFKIHNLDAKHLNMMILSSKYTKTVTEIKFENRTEDSRKGI